MRGRWGFEERLEHVEGVLVKSDRDEVFGGDRG